jgi:transcriptional regulator with XRE-family HTH domain
VRISQSPQVALGRAIRLRREEIGLTQEALADEAELDATSIRGLERGIANPTWLGLLLIAATAASGQLWKRRLWERPVLGRLEAWQTHDPRNGGGSGRHRQCRRAARVCSADARSALLAIWALQPDSTRTRARLPLGGRVAFDRAASRVRGRRGEDQGGTSTGRHSSARRRHRRSLSSHPDAAPDKRLRSFCGPFWRPLRSVCGLQTNEQPRTRANTLPRCPAFSGIFARVRCCSWFSNQSGRRDSNSGPHRPESGFPAPNLGWKWLQMVGIWSLALVLAGLRFGGRFGGFGQWIEATAQTSCPVIRPGRCFHGSSPGVRQGNVRTAESGEPDLGYTFQGRLSRQDSHPSQRR